MFRTASLEANVTRRVSPTSRQEIGLCSNRLNDRHADEPMTVFDELTKHLSFKGYAVSGALRHPFFVDCLRSDDYIGYSRLHHAIVPFGWRYEFQSADVLFAQEGVAERERRQILPLIDWLGSRGLVAKVLRLAPMGRQRRLWTSIKTRVRGQIALTTQERESIDSTSARVMEVFGFDRKFKPWFGMQVALSLQRYRVAQAELKMATPKPRVVVVNSEYHPISRALLTAAARLGIPTVLIQHGFLGQEWLHWPVQSDKVCVWGEVDRQWYLARGLSDERIRTTGIHSSFVIEPSFRRRLRKEHNIKGRERVIGFFAPNLDRHYHERAAKFLTSARSKVNSPSKWFVRPHPSQAGSDSMREYRDFEMISATVPLEEVLALTDVVLHDYSTMAHAQFAGLETVCVELDPPYPRSYRSLLGGQNVVASTEALRDCITSVNPSYEPVSGPTSTMAACGEKALNEIGGIISKIACRADGADRSSISYDRL